MGSWRFRSACLALAISLLVTGSVPVLAGGDPNECDVAGEEPDVIVGSIYQIRNWGKVGNVTGFSIGTISCNVGTCWLDWFSSGSNLHPVIGQNAFRLRDGRFEQIGQSWLKHGFQALSQDVCSDDCVSTNGTHLGVNCSDPYSSNLNGDQDRLGPKFEVNAATGSHPHPVTDISETGNNIFKRIQLRDDDLDPALNPGALYFVEGQYVTQDDTAAGNQNNSASFREVSVDASGNFDLTLEGSTQLELPAIYAWEANDVGVLITNVDVPSDGRFLVGARVTDLGADTWHYEYAVQNFNSDRAGGSFSVPIPAGATITNIGFRDIHYHSGEPQLGTDWTDNGGVGGAVSWTVVPEAQEVATNALRWGTLYNFRFDADVGPEPGDATIGLHKVGSPASVAFQTTIPMQQPCNTNGSCDAVETSCYCSTDCGAPPAVEASCFDGLDDDCDSLADCADSDCCADASCSPTDADGDLVPECLDCDDSDGTSWDTPGEATGLLLSHEAGVGSTLSWVAPLVPGGNPVAYETLRSPDADDFGAVALCMSAPDPTSTTLDDPVDPLGSTMFAYLVRAVTSCAEGGGPLGEDSSGAERIGRTCP